MKVTALINSYNYGRYIEEAIESVLRQDYPATEMEIVVVDDGSTDDTAARVQKYGERVRYIFQDNAGQGAAITRGYAAAGGEIIALLDADDLWDSRKISRVVEAFEGNPAAGMVYHRMRILKTETNSEANDPYFGNISTGFPFTEADALRFNGVPTTALAFRRGHLENILPVPESIRIMADFYLAGLLVLVAPAFALNEVLATYREHGSNLFLGTLNGHPSERTLLRAQCHRTAISEMRAWIRAKGMETESSAAGLYVKRLDLTEREMRYGVLGAGRREFADFLLEKQKFEGGNWKPGYRLFQGLVLGLAYCLGYSRFSRLREIYARNKWLSHWREVFFPSASEDGVR